MKKTRRVVAAAVLGLVLVAAACEPAGPFTPTTDMHAARAGHTATLLLSDRVLVLGGSAAGQPSVERYDRGSGSWLVRAEMLTPRSGHRATRLSSGKVLVTGGRSTATGNLLTAAEVYDPANDRWDRAAGTPYPGGHSTALLPNGKVLAVFADDRDRGWLYDPVADAWAPTAAKTTIAWRTTTVLPDGDALVVGGDNVRSTDSSYGASRAEQFDPDTGQWSFTSPAPRLAVTQATTVDDGRVLAIGPVIWPSGSYFETATFVAIYHPGSGTWSRSPEVHGCDNLRTAEMTLTGLGDGSALVAGRGSCADRTYPLAVRVQAGAESTPLEGFDQRGRHAAVRLADGRVLLTGGAFGNYDAYTDCCPFEVRATAELFTP